MEAEKVIFACHYPFVDFPGLYFARMYQQRSYVVALEHAPLPEGICIGAGPQSVSLRRWGEYLLLGGGGTAPARRKRAATPRCWSGRQSGGPAAARRPAGPPRTA